MNVPVPNLEEAANVAAEFIYSIDNLPSEVSHLLQEIKHRESRAQELQQEIDRDSAKYIRHSLRASSASATPPSPSSRAPSPKSVPLPAKISASYAEIQDLAAEKCALAERLVEIINRTRAKLDVDIVKVRTLQGEPPELIAAAMGKPPTFSMDHIAMATPGRTPALAISESLRSALTMPLDPKRSVSAAPSPSASTSHATKKRRVTQTTSIKISPAATPTKNRSASPTTVVTTTLHTQQKSRLSRQVHPPAEEMSMDVDGEEDGEGEEENEDETLYCFCQKQSYGDMIACDNEGGCPYEWFHLACVGLKQPTPEKWYCSACMPDMTPQPPPQPTGGRKGRKKY